MPNGEFVVWCTESVRNGSVDLITPPVEVTSPDDMPGMVFDAHPADLARATSVLRASMQFVSEAGDTPTGEVPAVSACTGDDYWDIADRLAEEARTPELRNFFHHPPVEVVEDLAG